MVHLSLFVLAEEQGILDPKAPAYVDKRRNGQDEEQGTVPTLLREANAANNDDGQNREDDITKVGV